MEEMKKEVLQLQKDLLQEKAKVKSLKTELENPLNVHRWRKLEGNDPPTLELINKIQSLQVLSFGIQNDKKLQARHLTKKYIIP